MKIMNLPILPGFLLILFLSGCEKELDLNIPVADPKLVVEGWIENGRPAEVILSLTAPYFSSIDSENLRDYAVTQAKVTLFCEGKKEILTLTSNQAYFPPYSYKSIDIKGQTGKKYSIEVILHGDTITAETTIPQPVNPDSVWFAPDPGKTSQGRIWLRATDPADEVNYYRVLYKRKGQDKRFIPGNFSTFSDILFNGQTVEMAFLRGYSSLLSSDSQNYFVSGDTVTVKLCSIDKEQFDFWNGYQNAVLASANPLATSNSQLRSNIHGGLGIWTGYGAAYYNVICP
jgi:hypothetical protein